MHPIDEAQLHFNDGGLFVLNIILALIMFGVALDLRVEDFRRAVRHPLAPTVGLFAQFVLLPPATLLLSLALGAPPSVALGMLLVAA